MNMHDFHYSYADLGKWSLVEAQLGIISACMPVMQPVLRRIAGLSVFQRLLSSSWLKSSSDEIVTQVDRRIKVKVNSIDRVYPLDTVDLIGKPDGGVGEIATDVERASSSLSP